jgi:hypothetical protein
MGDNLTIRWLDAPEDKDYPAAASYLGLLFPDAQAQTLVRQLQTAPLARFKAKDILRASGLVLLGADNPHVAKDRKKLQDGGSLSPILLVRSPSLGKVIVADGFHRLCAVYPLNEDEWIPCKIA